MKHFLIRDSAGDLYDCWVENAEAVYKLYASVVLGMNTSGDFDTGNIDIDVAELLPSSDVPAIQRIDLEN